MTELKLQYSIAKETPWKPTYVDAVSAEDIAAECHAFQLRVTEALTDTTIAKFVEGFKEYLRIFYLREVVIGEGICDPHTTIDSIETLLAVPVEESKVAAKTQNLFRALNIFLPETQSRELDPQAFTPELLCAIHREVGQGVIPNAGTLRTKWLAPAHEDWIYLDPHLVPKALAKLCKDVERALERLERTDLLSRVRLVASFMTVFLHIHPFPNGNGRVARLAVSWLLSDITIVPIALIASTTGRDAYLEALRDSRHYIPFLPSTLARLILESIHKTLQKAICCLDL